MCMVLLQFFFVLVIFKIFILEFYFIGVLFVCYGMVIMLVVIYWWYEGNCQFFDLVESEDESSSGEENDLVILIGFIVWG